VVVEQIADTPGSEVERSRICIGDETAKPDRALVRHQAQDGEGQMTQQCSRTAAQHSPARSILDCTVSPMQQLDHSWIDLVGVFQDFRQAVEVLLN